jgi:dipeptidyl aminopeptidase/acylaminoacyl peptidase
MRRKTQLCCWTIFVLVAATVWAAAAEAAFPGANGKLCFSRHMGGNNTEIFVMEPDGSGVTQLTFNSTEDLNCAWSADGTKIAFQTDRNGDHEVYVMNADGSAQTPLTADGAFDGAPAWSPDGTQIAFQSNRDGDDEVFVMNADGTGQTQITASPATDGGPAWSPDGTKIAFSSAGIKVMNPDGTSQTTLTTGTSDSQPDWSPDGTKITFDSPQDGDFEIYTMDADGSNQAQLTFNTRVDAGPEWSPEGTQIAFYTDVGNPTGITEVYTMNADGSSPTNRTNNSAIEGAVDWQPLDATPPTITITTPADGASYLLGSTVLADFDCQDPGGSGVASCVGTVPDGSAIDTASVGPKTFTVNAADNAGNPSSLTHDYTVAYDFSGFFQPVDNLPTLNEVKAGSAIPVKFSLGGDQGLSILAAGYPKSEQIMCSSTAEVDGIESTVTAGSSGLTYDSTTDRYTYVWKTSKSWASTCRQLVVKLDDTTSHRASFKFK